MPDFLMVLRTARFLRPVQIYKRLWFRFTDPRPRLAAAPTCRQTQTKWIRGAPRERSLIGRSLWRLLGEEIALASASDWQAPNHSDLLRYNLHYFDDLNAERAIERRDWHRELIARWVRDNPPAHGVGWAPYPTSLRMVNWIKATLSGFALSAEAVHSLAVQARQLERRLEWHLLGNHLFTNAKALVFAGCYFDGDEGRRWLARGLSILERELGEQVLPDGGQFELSPMYHALAFEDLLDLINLAEAFYAVPAVIVSRWREVAAHMGFWLEVMCHPDGEIAFFNDAAIGIAPKPAELFGYAARLGVAWSTRDPELTHLADSGYIRAQIGPAVLLIDVARIGPDYLPGHAHADTLSFELSLLHQRVLVNSGTSCYGVSAERLRQRGTAAHNTVFAGGRDSSEVWSGFRVARRARPSGLKIQRDGGSIRIECVHDGYCRDGRRLIHRREWRLEADSLVVWDTLNGDQIDGQARFHLHPGIRVDAPSVQPGSASGATIVTLGEDLDLISSTWHPRFGTSIPNCAVVNAVPANYRTGLRFAWYLQSGGILRVAVTRIQPVAGDCH